MKNSMTVINVCNESKYLGCLMILNYCFLSVSNSLDGFS